MERFYPVQIIQTHSQISLKKIKVARLAYENALVERSKLNPKLLYKYLNSQQSVKDSIRALKTANGELTQEPREIANQLNKYFQDV